jgi:hypothetical protein
MWADVECFLRGEAQRGRALQEFNPKSSTGSLPAPRPLGLQAFSEAIMRSN